MLSEGGLAASGGTRHISAGPRGPAFKSGRPLKTLATYKTPHAFFLVPGTHRIIVTDDADPRIIDDRMYRMLGDLELYPSAG